jgi:ribosomal-protein-serine acetyltransferase
MFRLQIAPELEIHSFAQSDAEPLYVAVERNRERLRQWLPWVDNTKSAADLALYIERSAAQEDARLGAQAGIWLDGALVGSIGCHPIDWKNRSTSIGYWLDADRQGKGVITRCTAVEIRCATGNHRSCAIPERLGFEREGIAREAEWLNDRFLDLVVWSMLAPAWQRRA